MALDKEIFKGKTLSDLFSEIYTNSKNTQSQVKGLIGELKPLIENVGDATLLVPMIKEYMEIGVKNDEHLIKLAQVVQRLEAIQSRGGEGEFDLSELQDLLLEQEEVKEEVKKIEEGSTEEEEE
tara:strand:- start:7218 stop:7589 length:372 start_codon:yes stop_codon:yes gene_type:complete